MDTRCDDWTLHLQDVRIPAGTRMRNHGHEAGLICAVISGAAMERDGTRKFELDSGSVRVSAPGTAHHIDVGPRSRFLLVEFPARFWDAIVPARGIFREGRPSSFVRVPALFRDAADLICEAGRGWSSHERGTGGRSPMPALGDACPRWSLPWQTPELGTGLEVA